MRSEVGTSGRLVDVGAVTGPVHAVGGAGRHILSSHRGRVVVRDVDGGLDMVMSCSAPADVPVLAVGPGGDRVAVLRADATVELHDRGGRTHRFSGTPASSPAATGVPGWLEFTSDGRHLLAGTPGAVHLLRADDLGHRDTAPVDELADWGESPAPSAAPAPEPTIAFASTRGAARWRCSWRRRSTVHSGCTEPHRARPCSPPACRGNRSWTWRSRASI